MIFRRPDWTLEGKDWPHRSHSRFVKCADIDWHVQILGSGPVLLLLHGTGASCHSFRELMPLLASRFTVVVPDLPGHAFSVASSTFTPSLSAIARALAQLLVELKMSPVATIGHSAGAAVLAQMLLDRSIAPLCLVGIGAALLPIRGLAGAFFPSAARLLDRSRFAAQLVALRARDAKNVERLVRSTGSTLNPDGIELYQRLARWPGHVAAVLAMLANWNLDSLFRSLPAIDTHVLLLAGEKDGAISIAEQREAAALISDSRLVVVPQAGHLLHEEQPALVARLILEEIDESMKRERGLRSPWEK